MEEKFMLDRRVYLFVFLIFVNFVVGLLVADYGIKLLNFIALELFNKKDFYVFDTRYGGFGIFIQCSITTAFCFLLVYSFFCYLLYSKYQGINFLLIIFTIFIIYFFLFCLFFQRHRLFSFLIHFTPFCLMYIEIILLYRIKNK